MFKLIKEYFLNLVDSIIHEDFPNAAAEMAYMLVIGIFPFMLFLTAVFGWLGKQFFMTKLLSALSAIAPSDVIKMLTSVLKEVTLFQNGGLVGIAGFFVTLFLASNAIAVIIKGLNRANKIQENRSFIHVRLLSILMVFVDTFFLFISINLIIFGKVILYVISPYLHIPDEIINTVLILRWPIAFTMLFILAMINYYVLPARDFSLKRKSIVPGALFFCIFWLLGSWLFSLYVNELGTYNKVYGTIGTFAILMVWLYYTSIIVLIGGEINNQTLDKLTNQKDKDYPNFKISTPWDSNQNT